MHRTVKEWMKVISNADATNCSDSEAAANTVMYELGLKCNSGRSKALANAMVAYAKLLHKHGVTP